MIRWFRRWLDQRREERKHRRQMLYWAMNDVWPSEDAYLPHMPDRQLRAALRKLLSDPSVDGGGK